MFGENRMKLLFIGRFQPFHKAHLQMAIKTNKRKTEHIIAIAAAQESHTKRNPFTYCEREQMIRLAWEDGNMKDSYLKIVPLPDINDPKNWVEYVCKVVGDFDIVITNNSNTEHLFEEKNHLVSNVDIEGFGVSGTAVRECIVRGDPLWEKVVPPSVVQYIKSINGEERIRDIYGRVGKRSI